MEVAEQRRHALFVWFEEQMGPERAPTMMELIPPAGASELTTKRDLDDLEQRLAHRFEALESRMDLKLETLRSSTSRTFGTWLFASQAAVIVTVGALTALS